MFKWAKLFSQDNTEKEISSPDKRIRCFFILKNSGVFYRIEKDNKPIVELSRLGFLICGEKTLGDNLKLIRYHTKRCDEKVELHWGEDQFLQNNYNETTFYLAETKDSKRIMTLKFRVFDNAVAFRYEIPPQPKFQRITIADELTEFNINTNSIAWKIPAFEPDRYEYNYEKASVHELIHSVHTPLTM